jgi:uncharacterized protein (TIGR03435 family)
MATSPALRFAAASIKPATLPAQSDFAMGKAHVGANVDRGRVDLGFTSLLDMICQAYGVTPRQVRGPDWLTGIDAPRFDVLATLPKGATADQVPAMLRALLGDRFKLAVHRATPDCPIYALVVAKGGVRMRAAAPGETAPQNPRIGTTANIGAPGEATIGMADRKLTYSANRLHMEFARLSMRQLAALLDGYVDRPVVDQTALQGDFRLELDASMEDVQRATRTGPTSHVADESARTIFVSVQRLGLNLEPRTAPVETIVIDRVERAPTEN